MTDDGGGGCHGHLWSSSSKSRESRERESRDRDLGRRKWREVDLDLFVAAKMAGSGFREENCGENNGGKWIRTVPKSIQSIQNYLP